MNLAASRPTFEAKGRAAAEAAGLQKSDRE
jgi:hypothetical protein